MTYKFNFLALLPYWQDFLWGCVLSLELASISVVAGLALGLLTAIARRSRYEAVRLIAQCYIEVVRNTPFLVQVLFIFFALPSVGISLSPQVAAVLALSVNLGAFAAEIIRNGIDTVPKGQPEAGAALGLNPLQTFRYVILKPALRTIYPALSGQFVMLLLTTSVVSSISAEELMSIAQNIDSGTFRSFEVYVVVAVLYLLMLLIFSSLLRTVGRFYFSYPTR